MGRWRRETPRLNSIPEGQQCTRQGCLPPSPDHTYHVVGLVLVPDGILILLVFGLTLNPGHWVQLPKILTGRREGREGREGEGREGRGGEGGRGGRGGKGREGEGREKRDRKREGREGERKRGWEDGAEKPLGGVITAGMGSAYIVTALSMSPSRNWILKAANLRSVSWLAGNLPPITSSHDLTVNR